MTVLGIETSCDETAVAVVRDGTTLLSNVVATSIDLHKVYGGVVPEIAARSHIESMLPVVDEALAQAFGQSKDLRAQSLELRRAAKKSKIQDLRSKIQFDPWDKIDAIAVSYGAGLGGSLLIGVMTARTLAIVKDKPLLGVNHVEAHVYANFLTELKRESGVKSQESRRAAGAAKQGELHGKTYYMREKQPEFPMLALIVSGKHSQLVLFHDHFDYTVLGRALDDAVGEAFDKVAKIIGLPYPGGPSVEKAGAHGDREAYTFPKAQLEGRYDFSFSGLKTAVLRTAQKEIGEDFTFPSFKIAERLTEAQKHNIAASFQKIAIETLVDKAVMACEEYQPKSVVIAGGVAASGELRRQLTERIPQEIEYPDMKLCTDNGAMVATLGCYKLKLGAQKADPYTLSIEPSLSM